MGPGRTGASVAEEVSGIRPERVWSSRSRSPEADAAEVEPVHRLIDDTPDSGRDEYSGIQDGVRREGRLSPGDLDPEQSIGAVTRDPRQPLRLVDRAVEARIVEVRDVRVADGTDDSAVEQLVDERIRIAVVRPRDHIGDVEARSLHTGKRQRAVPRRRLDSDMKAD